jgi:ribosomal protein S18 acetylase RimI-like enzyme
MKLIKFATNKDILSVLDLLKQCHLIFEPIDKPNLVAEKLYKDPRSIILIEMNKTLAGCVFLSYDPMGSTIFHVAVAETYRKLGLAAELLDAARYELSLRGPSGCIFAYIVQSNQSSINFFSKKGYQTFSDPLVCVYLEDRNP